VTARRLYTDEVRSIADALRDETRRRNAELTPEARVDLALALGEADIAALCDARQISLQDARTAIAQGRRAGRQPSPSHDG
jgi:hypothetical protein